MAESRKGRTSGFLGPGEEIEGVVEAVSFDDTLGKLRGVVGEVLKEDRTIPVCSEEMYEVIADFNRGLESDRTAQVNTKYKTVDRKVRPVTAPLPEGSELRIKGVASEPSLRDLASIGHTFTDITLRELKIGGGGFLLLGRASPDIPSDRPLQMDGRFGYDADGRRIDAVFGAGPGGSDELGGRSSVAEQNDHSRMPVFD